MSADDSFTLASADIDVDRLAEEIRATVADKAAAGAYADARVARAERTNLVNLKDDEGFLDVYMQCLRDAVYVDINDFEIVERRRGLGPLLVRLKRGIWSLLRFYTYRLWSQQNQVNGMLFTAVEAMEARYRSRIGELERRVAELEGKLTPDDARD